MIVLNKIKKDMLQDGDTRKRLTHEIMTKGNFCFELEDGTEINVFGQRHTLVEIDENENKSFYILAYFESQPVGTARWRDSGEGIKLERFAVLKQFRKKGIGSALTDFIIDHVPKERKIYLNSQHSAIGFYKNLFLSDFFSALF